jgi:hypothetical protein
MNPVRIVVAALALFLLALPAWSQQPVAELPLDVSALKLRLRDTTAIGVFAKIGLRNQMDELLKLISVQHQVGQLAGISALRLPYDVLIQKVLAVIQHGDPSLARAIAGSREALWAVLADRDSFNAMTSRLAPAAT